MTDQLIQRASLLIEHKRYGDAEKELRQVLASDPNNVQALALLGITNIEMGKLDEALETIKQALGQQPDNAYMLYLMGLVYTRKDNLKEATKFAQSAISHDPHNADYFGLLAVIKLQEKNWEEALDHANRGLQVDPENLICLNTRSTALLKLNRKDESYQTIKEALHNDPHNSYTHANLGWGLLEQGDHQKALESFREALKLDPENQHAKAGLVEALKARYWFYRIFLQYTFWLTNKSAKYQWFFILGLWFGIRLLKNVSTTNPSLTPFLQPIIYLYSAFALSTWIVDPLSNLFLRLNVYGRYALSRDEINASNFTAFGFLFALAGLAGLLIVGGDAYLILTFFGVGFMILCGSMFRPTNKGKRTLAMVTALGISLMGVFAVAAEFSGAGGGSLFLIFIYGTIAYQLLINFLVVR